MKKTNIKTKPWLEECKPKKQAIYQDANNAWDSGQNSKVLTDMALVQPENEE